MPSLDGGNNFSAGIPTTTQPTRARGPALRRAPEAVVNATVQVAKPKDVNQANQSIGGAEQIIPFPVSTSSDDKIVGQSDVKNDEL